MHRVGCALGGSSEYGRCRCILELVGKDLGLRRGTISIIGNHVEGVVSVSESWNVYYKLGVRSSHCLQKLPVTSRTTKEGVLLALHVPNRVGRDRRRRSTETDVCRSVPAESSSTSAARVARVGSHQLGGSQWANLRLEQVTEGSATS